MAEIIGRVGWRNYVPVNNPLWDNLKAYYTGDNTANDSKGTYNGTLVNGATYSTGKIGSGFSLDGINDYLNISTFGASFSAPSSAHSYSAWVNTIGNGYNILIQNGNTYMGTMMGFQNARLNMWYRGGHVSVQSTATISNNVWTHISSTYDGSGTIKLYINGALDSTFTGKTWIDGGGACATNIGSYNAAVLFFNGKIDEVGAWGKELTAAEVTELYNGGAGKQYVAPVEASIVSSGLIMNLDARNALSYSGTGTVWTDLSGNGNNGTLINGTSYSSANGGTLVFDGINDYVSVPGLTKTLIASNFAFSMWYNSTSTAATRGIFEISGGSGSSSPSILLQINGTTIRYLVNNGWRMTSSISTNTWYNMSLTYDGTTWKSYINGVLANSYVGGQYGGGSLYIGSGYGGVYNGNIPQFATYNRALSQAEITANFNALKSRYGL